MAGPAEIKDMMWILRVMLKPAEMHNTEFQWAAALAALDSVQMSRWVTLTRIRKVPLALAVLAMTLVELAEPRILCPQLVQYMVAVAVAVAAIMNLLAKDRASMEPRDRRALYLFGGATKSSRTLNILI
jgi:hypothetical protein